jgi:hypothetical protein
MLRAAILACAIALTVTADAHAAGWRTCARVPDTLTGKVQARGQASCDYGRNLLAKIILRVERTGQPIEGQISAWEPRTRGNVTLYCDYRPRGHVVYLCGNGPQAARPQVRVWAGVRTG